MELLELKIFKDIAYEKSFVRAAELNYLTQPSISIHLKNLESKLGIKLFNRAPRRVALTPEGEHLLPYVEDLLTRFNNLKSIVSNAAKTPKGTIQISTIYSIGIYELAPLLKKFIRKYPDIHIRHQYSRADVIYDFVLREKIDLGIVAYPYAHPKIKITPFGNDRLVLIAPPQHRLANKPSIKLKEIEGERFIAFDSGIPTRTAIDQALEKKGVHVSIRMTNDNIDTLKKSVEVGLGISIVPSKAVEKEISLGLIKAIRISDLKLSRPLGIITLKNKILNYPTQLFVETLIQKPL